MSRNKENIPLTASHSRNGPLLSSSKQLASDEFFTDSLLDVTRNSSRIPSPSPQKPSLSKARRARKIQTARNAQNNNQRPSNPETTHTRSRHKNSQPSTPLRNGNTPPRVRTNSLGTPPQSQDNPSIPSPYISISSPPPQDLTDTYQRIYDDEDLAQTERELSSDESQHSEVEGFQHIRPVQRSFSESPLRPPPTCSVHSRASTPTRSTGGAKKEARLIDRTETMSEASGLSFLKEMTDQGLAAALTPHMTESARDKARLNEVWGSRAKPIPFSKAEIPRKFDAKSASSISASKVVAFSKAAKFLPNGSLNGHQYGENGTRPDSRQSGTGSHHSSHDTRQSSDLPAKPLPTNTRVDRNFNFSTNHGFPAHRTALTEKNLEQQNRGSPIINHTSRSSTSNPSLMSDRSANNAQVLGEGIRMTNGYASRIPQIQKQTFEREKQVAEEPSQIDWAAAAADIPIPSVENSFNSERTEATTISRPKKAQSDMKRAWEFEFTGQSFQVSESPLVRPKQEQQRDREIQGLAKQAVTTNRLSEIRERHSQESLRSASKSPRSRSNSRPPDMLSHPAPISESENETEEVGEPVPDTPVVIYRSSSNSGSDQASKATNLERPNIDRSRSHDHLQRLARAMSNTPRSSPPSDNVVKDIETEPIPMVGRAESKQQPPMEVEQSPAVAKPNPGSMPVAQTPKVVGAWTDTILPDTVKTVKQTGKKAPYAQTPHISAGGWVDTPLPVEQRKSAERIPTIIEEVPEELLTGIVKDNSGSDTIKIEALPEVQIAARSQPKESAPIQPKSALASILDQQKNRLVSQDITNANKDDTLNLGSDTIGSLQGILDENDITTLSKLSLLDDETKPLGENQAESELLERLGVKLDRLRNNIHDARKGISKLEHQVSQPVEKSLQPVVTPQQLLAETTCPICGQLTFHPHDHAKDINSASNRSLPYTSLTFSLPIPHLFHPRAPNQRIPRPTPFGCLTLVLWLWYLTEITMCEIYSRPKYTDFYVWPDLPEPEFPFVLPTMLARWTRVDHLGIGALGMWLWSFLTGLLRAMWRVLGMLGGWSDGFVGEGDDATASVASAVRKAASSATVQNLAESVVAGLDMMSMNDDEFI